MAVIGRAIVSAINLPVGINVLRNDPTAALAIATVCGARFIRVNVHAGVYATDQGIIEGRADETLRYRKLVGSASRTQPPDGPHSGPYVAIFADVHVKHAQPLSCPDIAEAAEETAYRGRADGLIVSGTGTGKPTSLEDIRTVKRAVPDRPLLVGSGATPETASDLLKVADGLIVGTAIKQNGSTTAPVDPDRARRFIDAAMK
jgi:membrane complex biogenesis BtpA family protein